MVTAGNLSMPQRRSSTKSTIHRAIDDTPVYGSKTRDHWAGAPFASNHIILFKIKKKLSTKESGVQKKMSLVSGFPTAYTTVDSFCSNFYANHSHAASGSASGSNSDYCPQGGLFSTSGAAWSWNSGGTTASGATANQEYHSPPVSCYSATSPYSSPCHGYGSTDYVNVGAGSVANHNGYSVVDADYNGLPRVRVVKRRNTANKKERRRTQSINNAFTELRDCIPNVPADTKLSKIKTLRLATSYISYLTTVLEAGDSDVPFRAEIARPSKSDKNQQQQQQQQHRQQQQQHEHQQQQQQHQQHYVEQQTNQQTQTSSTICKEQVIEVIIHKSSNSKSSSDSQTIQSTQEFSWIFLYQLINIHVTFFFL